MRVAIAVMARAPVPGRCKTRLGPALGAPGSARLYEAMLLDTLDALSSGLSAVTRGVILAAPEDDGVAALRALAPSSWEVLPQEGGDLGARLFAGAQQIGAPLVLVGSDSPLLPVAALRDAIAHLGDPRTVLLGPAEDGGYYAIGLGAPHRQLFEDIRWSTPVVAEQTRARCRELGLSVRELPVTYDVDEPHDLVRLRADLERKPQAAPRTARILFEARA